MDCREITLSIDALLDDELDLPVKAAIEKHLLHCSGCQAVLKSEQALRAALGALPVPRPAADFHARVLRNAKRNSGASRRHAVLGAAMAATLALGVGLGVLFAPSGTHNGEALVQADVQRVNLVQAVAQNVRLAFESGQSLQAVTLTVRLPADVELVGYPGQREISWQTDITAGVNALTLPLVMTGDHGGELVAELDHGAQRKRFRVLIEARAAHDAAVSMPHLVI